MSELLNKAIFMYCMKNGLGYIYGDFFRNSSGHPEVNPLSAGGGEGGLDKVNRAYDQKSFSRKKN
jgi:hypothetical protein